jgi:hypothetical protein
MKNDFEVIAYLNMQVGMKHMGFSVSYQFDISDS